MWGIEELFGGVRERGELGRVILGFVVGVIRSKEFLLI